MDEGMSGFSIKARNSSGGGGGGGGGSGSTGTKCGRWSPTTEQVKVLTDLFSSGLRTPSTDQIQKISSQLSFYGKIESKNVFYWFQNHKARERQKRRRVTVDHDENDFVHRSDKIPSIKNFVDMNKVLEPERVIETLQLFPLNAFDESKPEKLRLIENECKDSTRFSYTFETDMDYPPMDLRLSFLEVKKVELGRNDNEDRKTGATVQVLKFIYTPMDGKYQTLYM